MEKLLREGKSELGGDETKTVWANATVYRTVLFVRACDCTVCLFSARRARFLHLTPPVQRMRLIETYDISSACDVPVCQAGLCWHHAITLIKSTSSPVMLPLAGVDPVGSKNSSTHAILSTAADGQLQYCTRDPYSTRSFILGTSTLNTRSKELTDYGTLLYLTFIFWSRRSFPGHNAHVPKLQRSRRRPSRPSGKG